MKKWRILLAALLAVAMICTLIACGDQKDAAGKPATITFYNNGQVYETVTAEVGQKLTLPEAPKAEKGLGLAGWSTIDGDVEEIIDPETFVVYGDMSLYAVWADVFTVTINADNGTPFEVKEVLAGATLEKPADPVKEGSRFVEWRDALQDVTFDFSRPIYNDVILKAMYGDGSPNRVSDTKWDFSGGIHGAWTGGQGGWKYQVNGLLAEDMVYETTEDGYAAWGFTLTDSLDNIPVVDGNNPAGLGMKYIYNEGISVEASKAKLVVIYLKPKYFPIDMATSPNDQFRISVLTSNGGMIYGYGNGSDAWSLRTDGAGEGFIQVDQMEDGWLRVQFKIHKLDVWSEDAIIKSMSISFVQRKATPVMDIISVKSIELLDQEEFIDPHKVERTTKSEWDMSNSKDAADWDGYHAKKKHDSLTTKVTGAGMAVNYQYPGNGWKGLVLENALLDISKLTGKLSFTYSSQLPITSYRIHILTDLGGKLTANGTEECYVAANISDIDAGKLPAWTRKTNADGSVTVTFDLNSLAYFADGTELKGLTIVTVTANKVTGTVTYKSIEMEKDLSGHDCEAEGHYMKEASCIAPMTCYVCGYTEGTVEDHTWEAATCQNPKTCSVCRKTEGTVADHKWSAATCQKPKTCTVCGQQYGAVAAHSYKDGFCSVCGIPEVIRTEWDMRNAKAAADWNGYHAKKKNEALTTTVTHAGFGVEYQAPGNGWKGIILEKTAIATDKLTGKLTFTYSSDMPITSYRIHILTDLGGKLTANGTAANYVAASIADITAGKLEAWTQTTNPDGSVTVTFDLRSLAHFANGKELKGLTIVTVTANKVTGTVTYKNISLELDPEGYDCQADGHMMKDATCLEPKTCRVCGATEGEALGHTWMDATCTEPKICTVCGETEGEPSDHVDADGDYKCDNCGVEYCSSHNWIDATCTAPKTCSVCGATEGEKLAHTDANKDHVCDVCANSMVIWYMNNAQEAADWTGYHSKKKNEALTTAVTEAGFGITYGAPGNGWKGIVLENTAIDISKLGGKLSFTYSSDMAITSYRIHILTDLGGNLTANGTADCYVTASVSSIAAGNLAAWTQTTNSDGSVTVTFDLSTMGYFANGTELKGLTIVTVTANGVTGTVTYKTIELEKLPGKHDCQTDGHIWKDATCLEPKTCSVCGATEGEALGHSWVDATCTAPKTCSVCGETEGDVADHTFANGVCTACGTAEIVPADSTVWDMIKEEDAADWTGYHAKKKNEKLTTTVTTNGMNVYYQDPGNGWKGIVLEDTAIDISKLGGKLSFTYSSDMAITNYRIHILTDRGGNLTGGSDANYYASASIANITAGNLEAWTQTTNAEGSVTVTFDLSTMGYFAGGTELRGLTIVTVTANNTPGNVTYKSIELEEAPEEDSCQINGHSWKDATCTEPKTCSVCGETEGEALGHAWVETVCLKTCSACGVTEETSAAHTYENGSCSVCGAKQWDTDSDGVLEILAIGNSFSTDATEYTWQIAKTLGIEKVVVGNLYIGGCTLNEHYTNASGNLPNYRYYYCDNGTWTYTEGYKISTALESRSWDYVSLQQASPDSGVESTYNEDLTNLIAYVKERSDAKLVWHMTWAYQQDTTHSAFPTYNSDQMTMYNAIVSAVQNKIVPNGNFALIVPNGTAVQNTRTSLVGDTLTRDGYHMSKDYGRYLTGLMFIKTVTGLDISGIEYAPDGVSSQYREIAVESVNNAYAHPFEVTQSAYQGADLKEGYILLQPKLYKGAYWNPTNSGSYNELIDNSSLSDSFFATIRFIREDLPVGSVITVAEGWQYRPDGWITDELQTGTRETNTTAPYIEVTEEWWGNYTIRSFNIAKVGQPSLADVTEEEVRAAFQIYVPEESHNHKFENGVCTLCGEETAVVNTQTSWDMSKEEDAADWAGYHAKKKNEALTTTVTEAGLNVTYGGSGNGWKGIVLEGATIDISKLTGKLTFTYSSDMAITNYRIHILTDLGGNLTANGTADNYVAASIANITAGNLEDWTQTTNPDGSVTVTFDLSTLGHFANGTQLRGLTIVTVTANKVTGTVTYKSIELEKAIQEDGCQVNGHSWVDATCTTPKTCSACGETEGEALGHSWNDATCTAPKTCSACGETEGEALGHSWNDATCTAPKTCSVCGATEGEPAGHTWNDATCTAPKTCSVCGATEGEPAGHNFVQSVCTVCSTAKPAQNEWNMSNEADAADWAGYHAKKKNEALTTTVTEAGFGITYETPGNGWKGVVLENVSLDISKLNGKLTFTYSSDMAITNYRIHILTDLGGSLTDNGTADCYTAVKISDITAGNLEGWTQTTNPDGSVTVTFDLSTMGYFKNGTKLQGLTIVTVTANKVTGTVTYKSIELEELPAGYDCQVNGHVMKDATCTTPKTCTVCGATEGEALGHAWVDADCDTPKTCSVCGETEGEPAGHNWADATCTTSKTCTVCGATEGEANGHSFAEGVCTVCGAAENTPASPIVWNMSNEAAASQWYSAQAYTSVKPEVTTSEVTADGFKVTYLHKNGWKGIVLKNVEYDITGLNQLSFTYIEEMDITNYRVHVLTDKGGDLGSNSSGTPSDYYAAVKIADIAQSSAWTRTVNADGSITVTFDLTTLPFFKEGTKLLGLDIVTVTATGTTGTVTYKSIAIR